MSQEAASGAASEKTAGPVLGALRVFLQPVGLLALLWAATAFVARPMLMQAHEAGAFGGMGLVGHARAVALAQFMSFAGCIAIAGLIHVRMARAGMLAGARAGFLAAAGYAVLLFAVYVIFLWSPVSVFTLIANDAFIFFDATYRIQQGQTPSLDFPTAIGSAAFYLPALGAQVANGFGGSVELASAMLALVVGLACAWICASRLSGWMTALLVIVVFVVATPAALLEDYGGQSYTLIEGRPEKLGDNLSLAMFYNRWGWAALIPVFALLVPRPDETRPPVADALVAAAGLALLFHLKLSYFGAGAAVAATWALTRQKPLQMLGIGAGMAMGLSVLTGLVTGNLAAYLRDAMAAASVSGGRTFALLPIVRENFVELVIASSPVALLTLAGKATWRDALAAGIMVLAAIFVVNQNDQLSNVVVLVVLAAYGVVRVGEEKLDPGFRHAAAGAFLVLALGQVMERSLVMIDQAAAARREEARGPTPWASIPSLANVYVAERESFLTPPSNDAATSFVRSQLYGRRFVMRQGEYMETLMAGAADLKSAMKPGETVATLDMANPFPLMLGAPPAKGAWLTLHVDRTFSMKSSPPADDLTGRADHVMIAKVSMAQGTADAARTVYGEWLDTHYRDKVESDFWIRYSSRISHAERAAR